MEDFSLAIVDSQTGWVPKPHFPSSTPVYSPAFGKDQEQSDLVRDTLKGTGKQVSPCNHHALVEIWALAEFRKDLMRWACALCNITVSWEKMLRAECTVR